MQFVREFGRRAPRCLAGTNEENAAEGSAIGAGAGSVIPGLGTAAGAAIGGAIGAAANTIGSLFGEGGTVVVNCPPLTTPGISEDCVAADMAVIAAQQQADAQAQALALQQKTQTIEAQVTSALSSMSPDQIAAEYAVAMSRLSATTAKLRQEAAQDQQTLSDADLQSLLEDLGTKDYATAAAIQSWLGSTSLSNATAFSAALPQAKAQLAADAGKTPPPPPPPPGGSVDAAGGSPVAWVVGTIAVTGLLVLGYLHRAEVAAFAKRLAR